jgi:hypothetical protein
LTGDETRETSINLPDHYPGDDPVVDAGIHCVDPRSEVNFMTHDELVKRAMRWLINTKACSVAVSELASGFEVPDVIGWRGSFSYLIEAKVSISDFRADQKKSFRRNAQAGLGYMRYYIVPLELKDKMMVELFPEKWGLLAAGERSVFVVKEPDPIDEVFTEHNVNREMEILLSIIRRISNTSEPLPGIGVKWYAPIYGSNHNSRAELYVEQEV